ncbi:MAG TPA: acetyltransferase [Gammaproteobacteria bacterium]|nr:acetyltransferase [Gammaproteobacteria bacterium]
MFLKESSTGELVEVLSMRDLIDPFRDSIVGRYNMGEDLPDPQHFPKSNLVFPSGEPLPRCWLDPDYRGHGAG